MAETKTENFEREYIIPLRKQVNKVPRYKRSNKAVKTIKEFIARHMKVTDRDLKKVKIDRYLNEEVWFRGIRKPPMKIKVKAIREGDIVRVELADMPEILKFKKAREERIKKKVEESSKKKEIDKTSEEKAEEKTEEKKKEEAEKKIATIQTEQKIEKQIHQKNKHQKGGKIDRAQQVRKKDLRSSF